MMTEEEKERMEDLEDELFGAQFYLYCVAEFVEELRQMHQRNPRTQAIGNNLEALRGRILKSMLSADALSRCRSRFAEGRKEEADQRNKKASAERERLIADRVVAAEVLAKMDPAKIEALRAVLVGQGPPERHRG